MANDPDTPGKVVVLNGFPGTGKLSILQRVQSILGERVILLDNHLLIDPVQAVLPGRGEAHHALRRAVRAPIFASLKATVKEPGNVVLMTACLAATEADAAVAEEHLGIVGGSAAMLFWVNAVCAWSVLERRVQSAGRREGKTKLTDPAVLHDLVTTHTLYAPPRQGNVVPAELDVSGDLEASARRLMEIVGLA
jgi:hypothetical protein